MQSVDCVIIKLHLCHVLIVSATIINSVKINAVKLIATM